MDTNLVRKKTPEEKELEKKQSEFAQIQVHLAQRELDLTTLRTQMGVFEREYLRVVGSRYAELDSLDALIAEAEAERMPSDCSAQQRARDFRNRADQSAHEATFNQSTPNGADFTPPDSLKRLYREIAKLVHPDLATDENDRIRRNAIMAEVNSAYSAGDEERLQSIFHEQEQSPKADSSVSIGADLVFIIRKIAQAEERLEQIEAEFVALQNSDLFRLRQRVEKAKTQAHDLLSEMATDVEYSISDRRRVLAELAAERLKKP